MIRFLGLIVSVACVGANVSCTKEGGSSPIPAAAPGSDAPVLQGTVSGGGGNGCDGRTFEQYAKRLSSLREYQYLIQPLLRRMGEQGNDPLLAYLQWAADEKVWYFVPCELQKLSTEQIGLAIQSDQLALHGEHGIYIHSVEGDKKSNSYFAKRMKAQAGLLLHEMVMGARLLMKQTATKQCAALAKKDAKICSDAQLMAIAEVDRVDPKQALIMDAADHEAVRAMTVFLSERGADLSTENLKATRERLGFNFPWKRAVSNLTYRTFIEAFARSRQLEDRYVVSSLEHFNGIPTECSIGLQVYRNSEMYMAVDFPLSGTEFLTDAQKSILHQKMENASTTSVCSNKVGRISSTDYRNTDCVQPYVPAWFDRRFQLSVKAESFEARGVLRDGQIHDEVKFYTGPGTLGKTPYDNAVVTFVITQEDAPRIQSVRLEAKRKLKGFRNSKAEASPGDPVDAEDAAHSEWLDIPGVKPLTCVRK